MRRKSAQKRAGHVDMVQAKHSLKEDCIFRFIDCYNYNLKTSCLKNKGS